MTDREWMCEAMKFLKIACDYNDHWGEENYHRWAKSTETSVKNLLAAYPEGESGKEKENGFDHKDFIRKLEYIGVPRTEAMSILGEVCELTQDAYMMGYNKGYNARAKERLG